MDNIVYEPVIEENPYEIILYTDTNEEIEDQEIMEKQTELRKRRRTEKQNADIKELMNFEISKRFAQALLGQHTWYQEQPGQQQGESSTQQGEPSTQQAESSTQKQGESSTQQQGESSTQQQGESSTQKRGESSTQKRRESSTRKRGPSFGQQGPSFKQRGPSFGQRGPTFGQRRPAFGQWGPSFGQQGPSFGQQGPSFGQEGPSGHWGPSFGLQGSSGQWGPSFGLQGPSFGLQGGSFEHLGESSKQQQEESSRQQEETSSQPSEPELQSPIDFSAFPKEFNNFSPKSGFKLHMPKKLSFKSLEQSFESIRMLRRARYEKDLPKKELLSLSLELSCVSTQLTSMTQLLGTITDRLSFFDSHKKCAADTSMSSPVSVDGIRSSAQPAFENN